MWDLLLLNASCLSSRWSLSYLFGSYIRIFRLIRLIRLRLLLLGLLLGLLGLLVCLGSISVFSAVGLWACAVNLWRLNELNSLMQDNARICIMPVVESNTIAIANQMLALYSLSGYHSHHWVRRGSSCCCGLHGVDVLFGRWLRSNVRWTAAAHSSYASQSESSCGRLRQTSMTVFGRETALCWGEHGGLPLYLETEQQYLQT